MGQIVKNRGETVADRLERAAEAKQALLAKARARDEALSKDPEFQARQAARVEAAKVRTDRETERLAAKAAERARLAAEEEARKAEEAARAAAEAERIMRGGRPKSAVPKSEAELKAARDARYAARKARKK
ncbi:MAG: hypothetical protein JOY81_14920 [Alphaproteobacteria bacterium]|nr:hypothetical protein [Alphaproteobacteria bacterium]